jgi:RPA family protein
MQRRKLTVVPTRRVFFEEFLQSDFFMQEDGMTFLVTPTCAKCYRLFGIGEVQEVEIRGNIARIKINDSTATLNIYTNKAIHVEGVKKAKAGEEKTFLAFLGNVRVRAGAGAGAGKRNILLAEEVGTVDERVRADWVLNTAWRTMERVELIRSTISSKKKQENVFSDKAILKEALEYYALDNDKLDALANMTINAVKSLWQRYHTTTKEMIIELVKKAEKVGRGMEREKLAQALKSRGLDEAWVEEVTDELIMEGRCYEADGGVLYQYALIKQHPPRKFGVFETRNMK